METVIRINTDEIGVDLIEGLKKLFPHKTVEITVQAADDTEYILGNPAYANDILQRINEYNSKKQTISIKAEELV